MLCECDQSVLTSTCTCKPDAADSELAILKGVASGHPEEKAWHNEGKPSWKGSVDLQIAHFEARLQASSLLRSAGHSADRQEFLYQGQDVDKSITDL